MADTALVVSRMWDLTILQDCRRREHAAAHIAAPLLLHWLFLFNIAL